ncbi:MAG: M1 family metallopeptidase [Clostridiales bacterium]|nr:M1 family metallopeptidase [Clostridiales bacterium]
MKKLLCALFAAVFLCGVLPVFTGCKKEVKISTVYEITAEYVPETATVAGTVKVTFENTTAEAFSVLKFQLYPNAYRKDALYRPVDKTYTSAAYYAGESYGEIVVSSVHGAKGWEVLGEDENILYVYLEQPLYPEDKIVVDIAFLTKLAKVNHRTGITSRAVNLGNFYPVLCGIKEGGFLETVYYSDGDPFVGECAKYSVRLTLPKEYTLAATGEVSSERVLESKRVYTVSTDKVRDFAAVLYPAANLLEETCGDTEILYYYYADETPQKTLEAAKESFAYFEKTFGKYPYKSYTLAETGFCYGGMEYPQLTLLSDSLKGEERMRAVVHETAHQWWYGVVGSDQIHEAWQDEGLAEYSALCFFENYEKYGLTREGLAAEALKEYRSYYDVYGSVLGRTDTRMSRHLKGYISNYEYRCIAYDKGVVMFDTLRKSVGDDKFFDGLKNYYQSCAYKIAAVGDLVAAFEKAGLDVQGFFDSFLEGKAIL